MKNLKFIIASFLLMSAILALYSIKNIKDVPICRKLSEFPITIGQWKMGKEYPMDDRTLEILKVDDYIFREYFPNHNDQKNLAISSIQFYCGYYTNQTQGKTVHSPKHCYPGSGWNPISSNKEIIKVPVSNGGEDISFNVNRMIIGKGDERQLVFYWYQTGKNSAYNAYWQKVHLFLRAALNHQRDGSFIRLSCYVADKEYLKAADITMREFLEDISSELLTYLPT